MNPTAPREPQREHRVLSDAPNERLGENLPDPHPVPGRSEGQVIGKASGNPEDDGVSISSYETAPENFDSRSNSPPVPPAPSRDLIVGDNPTVFLPAIATDVNADLCALEENTSNTGGGGGRPAVVSRGTYRNQYTVCFLLTPTSSGDAPRGHGAWGHHNSH